MGEFLALIAGQVGWAIPVGVVLWIVARRVTSVVPSPTAAGQTSREPGRVWPRALGLIAIAVMLWALDETNTLCAPQSGHMASVGFATPPEPLSASTARQ